MGPYKCGCLLWPTICACSVVLLVWSQQSHGQNEHVVPLVVARVQEVQRVCTVQSLDYRGDCSLFGDRGRRCCWWLSQLGYVQKQCYPAMLKLYHDRGCECICWNLVRRCCRLRGCRRGSNRKGTLAEGQHLDLGKARCEEEVHGCGCPCDTRDFDSGRLTAVHDLRPCPNILLSCSYAFRWCAHRTGRGCRAAHWFCAGCQACKIGAGG
mmetsp:Transcript_62427/g.115910  ORF Transcript_62427/g.115910 Transcript_62427/m.115910 type:complete len:210 (-) Transcript_62427:51-680(-)